jgi:hypothetical protein
MSCHTAGQIMDCNTAGATQQLSLLLRLEQGQAGKSGIAAAPS